MGASSLTSAEKWGEAWQNASRRWDKFARKVAKATGWKVWNPGEYGEVWHAELRRCYPPRRAPVMILGLNPGPYGMAQTGIPFTDIKRLQECLPKLVTQLRAGGADVEVPGLAPRSLRPFLTRTFESSSVRVYRFLTEAYGSAEQGLRNVVVANPCPLLFLSPETRKNVTPADLTRAARAVGTHDPKVLRGEMDQLRRENCEEALRTLKPAAVVLLGRDVQAALGEFVRSTVAADRVLDYEHPARAIPEKWSRELRHALTQMKVLELAKTRTR